MLELLIDNKNGNMWDVSNIASGISWTTSRIGKPGKLDFTIIRNGLYQDEAFKYENGDVVRLRKDGTNIFYGYIFSVDHGKDEDVKISCYDQIRYLMNTDTYVLSNITASEVLQKIASDFNLKLGRVEDTAYRIPAMLEDGKRLLDIICKALDLTLINSGRNYFLYDDFGELSLRLSSDFLTDFYIGDGSLMYDYSSKLSIDSDTYNRIKLYRDNKKTGKREIYLEQDSENIAKWGLLQLYQSVEEEMNEAQIKELLSAFSTLKNRQSRSLKIEALGDAGVRAGFYIPVVIEEYGINQPFLVEECTHKFDGEDHTMSLELKVI